MICKRIFQSDVFLWPNFPSTLKIISPGKEDIVFTSGFQPILDHALLQYF